MFTLEGRPRLEQVVELRFAEIRQSFLEQLKPMIEGRLEANRRGRVHPGPRGGVRCATRTFYRLLKGPGRFRS